MRCEICGGSSTCPANNPPVLLPEGYPITIPYNGKSHSELERELEERGLKITHSKLRYVLAIPQDVTVEGTAQSHRICAHFQVERVWVGQCSYAFVLERPEDHENNM